jgi:hypothetical protein
VRAAPSAKRESPATRCRCFSSVTCRLDRGSPRKGCINELTAAQAPARRASSRVAHAAPTSPPADGAVSQPPVRSRQAYQKQFVSVWIQRPAESCREAGLGRADFAGVFYIAPQAPAAAGGDQPPTFSSSASTRRCSLRICCRRASVSPSAVRSDGGDSYPHSIPYFCAVGGIRKDTLELKVDFHVDFDSRDDPMRRP